MDSQGKSIMQRFAGSTILLAIVLVGCSSFNGSFNHYSIHLPPDAPPVNSSDDGDTKVVADTTPTVAQPSVQSPILPSPAKATCDVSPFYSLPAPPEIPTKALQAATDVNAIEKIERKHIDDLRQYISELRKQHRKIQLRFYEKCNVISK